MLADDDNDKKAETGKTASESRLFSFDFTHHLTICDEHLTFGRNSEQADPIKT